MILFGDNALIAEIRQADGTKLGLVPLKAATITTKLDQIGTLVIEAPASHPNADLMSKGRRAYVYFNSDRGKTLVGVGILLKKTIDVNNQTSIKWDAVELLEELRYPTVGRYRVYNNVGFAEVASDLIGLASGWTVTPEAGVNPISIRFDGGSAWKAFTSIAAKKGLHVRRAGEIANLQMGTFGTLIELTAVNLLHLSPQSAWNSAICGVKSLRVIEDSMDVVNWVEPLAGNGGIGSLNLKYCTRTSPYTIQTDDDNGYTRYFLADAASIAEFGTIQRTITLPDVLPVEVSEFAIEGAANMLYDWAAVELGRIAQPTVTYGLSVVGLQRELLVGDKIRLIYKGVAERNGVPVSWIDVNEELWVLEIKASYGTSGIIHDLVVSNLDKLPPDAASMVAEGMSQLRDSQVGQSLTLSGRVDTQVTQSMSSGVGDTIELNWSKNAIGITRLLMTISRANGLTDPGFIAIEVDGQLLVDGPYLLESSELSVTLNIESYVTNGLVPLLDTHTVALTPASGSGTVQVQFDLVEVILAVS